MSGNKYYVKSDTHMRHTFTAENDMQALLTAFIMGYEDTEVYQDGRRVGITPRFVCKSVWEDEYLDKMRRELP